MAPFPALPAGPRGLFAAIALTAVLWRPSPVAAEAPAFESRLHAVAANETAAYETGFVRRVFHDEDGEHGYVVYVPRDYRPDRSWPVMLFLHGAGERGNDGVRQSEAALGAMIRRWGGFPWIVVFPQAEDTRSPIRSVWAADAPDGRRALAILDQVERSYSIDPGHRVLTGWSMGGRGAYMLAAAFPDKWSAVVPIAGWADLDLAKKLVDVPIWSFHGTSDPLVSFDEDRVLIEAIRAAGGSPLFTDLSNQEHYIWRIVYASPVVFDWMSDPARFANRPSPELDPIVDVVLPQSDVMGPFRPGIEMSRAVAVRLGPDLFRDLSTIASEEMAATPLEGWTAGTSTTSQQGCLNFRVQTSQIGYHAPITKVDVIPTAAGTLCLRVAISDAQLFIGRTDVRGLLCSATAGPMWIRLGHRSPILIEAEAVPYIHGEQFRLRTTTVRFSIPHGNWHVTRPVVDSHSLLLPADTVADSLVDGYYENKQRIEQEFRRSIAGAIDGMKLELPEVSDDQMLTTLWPVPAYRPRIRPHPQQIKVDVDGLVIIFDLTVAAVDHYQAPAVPRAIDYALSPSDIGQGDLAVAAAEGLLEPLTKQLIDAGLAHINVLDVPQGHFTHLADRATLSEAIPALKELPPTAEIRTELYLREPLKLNETQEPVQACDIHGCFTLFGLRVPNVAAVVSVRNSADEPWRDYVEFNYDVMQSIRLEVGPELESGREIISVSEDQPRFQTSARWLVDSHADGILDVAAATRLFQRGWNSWADTSRPTSLLVPDIALRGYVRRLDRLEPGTQGMVAVFEEPETILKNDADVPLHYRTKRPQGGWGSLLTLPPGERHIYRVPRPLGIESESSGRHERYDIPPGRDVRFRTFEDGPPGLVLEPLATPQRMPESIPGTGN